MDSSCENMGVGKSGEASITLRVAQVPEISGEQSVRRAGRMKRRTRQKERKSSWGMMDLSIFFDQQPSILLYTSTRDVVFSSHAPLFFDSILLLFKS